jgi:hypothetical protein
MIAHTDDPDSTSREDATLWYLGRTTEETQIVRNEETARGEHHGGF